MEEFCLELYFSCYEMDQECIICTARDLRLDAIKGRSGGFLLPAYTKTGFCQNICRKFSVRKNSLILNDVCL